MEKLTIGEIEKKLLIISDERDPFLSVIEKDERKGAQRLLAKWHKNKEREQQEKLKFQEMSLYEIRCRKQGYQSIAGIDEVGRGPLAGPVIAAAVILPENIYLPGIDDSKKLSEQKREEFFDRIMDQAIAVGVGRIDAEEIDVINILEASKKAMVIAISELPIPPDYLLIDAVKLITPYPQEAIIKGDAKSISIAAASIVAKVTRDRLMKELDQNYPQYGFSRNMGYGTKEHLQALDHYGVSPYHRLSFAPIKDAINR